MVYNTCMSVLVIGSVTCDVSLYVDHLPSVEDDVNVRKQKMSVGGCAYNVANMLRLTGVNHQLVSCNGTGLYASFVRDEMRKKGMAPMFRSEEENGVCYTLVDGEGNRTFMAAHGAEYHFSREMLASVDLKDTDLIWFCGLDLEDREGENIVSFLEENRKIPMFFSPGPRILSISEDVMKRIVSLHPSVHLNYREASAFLRDDSLNKEETVRQLHEKGFERVVMTDGGNPAVIYDQGQPATIPACQAHVIDGTGAGDSHIGTVLGCLEKGMNLKESVVMANRIGAAVTECEGPVLTEEKYEEIRKELS